MSGIAEVIVPLPHLVAVDRLPARLVLGRLVIERTGEAGAVDVVGSLRGHAARARWRSGRREGDATYEVVRTHGDRCALTVVLDGLDCATARAVAEEARLVVTAAPAAGRVATTGTVTVRTVARATRPA